MNFLVKLFTLLARECKKGKLLIIFDEISWMGSKDPDFLGKLKNAWDNEFKQNPKLLLFFCGSISTWIDANILSSTAFYGRISWVIELGPLPIGDCNKLLERQGFRGSAYEKFKILSVMGGVPWYLEQIQGNLNADNNIRRHCFTKGGVLVNEFNNIFHDTFDKRDHLYKNIVNALANGPMEYEALCRAVGYKSSGRFSEYLTDLAKAGFISRDYTWSLSSGKESRISQFRISDNYLRFYLKYIEPNRNQIDRDRYQTTAAIHRPGWDSVMGLQFENLILNNRNKILNIIGIKPEDVLADNPYSQRATTREKGCQIDYLIHTRYNNLYLCEIKFSRAAIRSHVIADIKEKIARLKYPKKMVVIPVLITVNGASVGNVDNGFFYRIIDFTDFLE